MTSIRLPRAVACVFFAAGCGSERAPELGPPHDSTPVASAVGAGLSLNGTAVTLETGPERTDECWSESSRAGTPLPSGVCHNGPLLSGLLASVNLSQVTLVDGPLDGPATLGGTVFSGTVGGVPKQGTGFVGALLTGTLDTGGTVQVRIDSALQGSGSDPDVWEYVFSYKVGESWPSVCAGGVRAIPVLGRWDYSQGTSTGGDKISDSTVFTVGCQGSAVAKCVNAGYKPWATASGVSLDSYHQACVRMIRADYCGNGSSYTSPNRLINIRDNLGIQIDGEGWFLEAKWTPAGARCASATNRNLVGGVLCSPVGTLSCLLESPFAGGTLLISETPLLGGVLGGPGVSTLPQ